MARWNGSAWTCGFDNNTTYSGNDFARSGQSCPTGQFATGIDANGSLMCAAILDSDIIQGGGNHSTLRVIMALATPPVADEKRLSPFADAGRAWLPRARLRVCCGSLRHPELLPRARNTDSSWHPLGDVSCRFERGSRTRLPSGRGPATRRHAPLSRTPFLRRFDACSTGTRHPGPRLPPWSSAFHYPHSATAGLRRLDVRPLMPAIRLGGEIRRGRAPLRRCGAGQERHRRLLGVSIGETPLLEKRTAPMEGRGRSRGLGRYGELLVRDSATISRPPRTLVDFSIGA